MQAQLSLKQLLQSHVKLYVKTVFTRLSKILTYSLANFIIKKRHKICPLFKQWIISEFQFLPGTLKIFSGVLSPFTKWPSFTLFLHRCIQCHSILLILFWTIWISANRWTLPRKAKLSSTSDFPVLMFKIEKAVKFS